MIHINLIPKSVQHEHQKRLHTKRWIIASLCAAVMIALPWGYDWISQMRVESITKENRITSALLQEEKLTLETLTKNVQDAELKLQRANALRQKRSWSGMITLIATAMPSRSWIISIATVPAIPPASTQRTARIVSQTLNKVEVEPVTIEVPRKLQLVGYAADASEPMQFVTNLKAFGVFENVTLLRSYLEPVEDDKYFRFELMCEW